MYPITSINRWQSSGGGAGNSGSDADNYSPASAGDHPNVYTVSAVDNQYLMSSWSNWDGSSGGDDVDAAAPGFSVPSYCSDGSLSYLGGALMDELLPVPIKPPVGELDDDFNSGQIEGLGSSIKFDDSIVCKLPELPILPDRSIYSPPLPLWHTYIEQSGLTSLVKDPCGRVFASTNYLYHPVFSSPANVAELLTLPFYPCLSSITYQGIQIKDGHWAGWSIIGAETINGTNNVAWKHSSGNIVIWDTDSSWNYDGGAFYGSALSSEALQWETAFGQDFNSDSIIGKVTPANF